MIADSSRFFDFFGVFTIGVAVAANLADGAITAAGAAEFTAIVDDLQVQGIPLFFWKQAF